MAIRNFVVRPATFEAVQWDGSNFAEIQEWINTRCPINGIEQTVTDNANGTITTDYGLYGRYVIHTGDWLTAGGPSIPQPSSSFLAQYEEVTGSAPFAYAITGSE